MKKTKPNKPPSGEYQRFEKLAKALIAVPKSTMIREKQSAKRRRLRRKEKSRTRRAGPNSGAIAAWPRAPGGSSST